MKKIIQYFINNSALNHTLLLFILFAGILAYNKIPKEIFPNVELNKIMISGAYVGTSASTLDMMAVRDIEDDVSAISGVSKSEAYIRPGRFTVILTLSEDAQSYDVLNKVKDSISALRQNLPPDMNEPIANVIEITRPLIKIAMGSNTLEFQEFLEKAREIKSKVSKRDYISDVQLYGESDLKVEIKIDKEALLAYKMDANVVIAAIGNLSYIYPIGDIDDKDNFIFVSTVNGKANQQEWEDTMLDINGQFVYLKDIAKVRMYHPQDDTLSSFNGKNNLTLRLSKTMDGDAIALAKELRVYGEALAKQYPEISFDFYQDLSQPIDERLSIILANLTFGLILIFVTMYLLINRNTAIVVTLGVPFAFIIGLLFIYYGGYSLNMISLIGALLVVGIAVDDAVVVSENIQRHIDEGMDPKEAAIAGTKEVALPIILATMTTVAAFLPMFMLGGEMGLFIKLIPIVVVMVLLGSLLESFFFLPLHAKTLLKKGDKSLNWAPLVRQYEKVLHNLIKYKKSTLILFFILVPILSVITAKSLHFQLFPAFDAREIHITGKMNINTTIEESFEMAKIIENEILEHKEEYSIRSSSALSGIRRNLANRWDRGTNLLYVSLELEEQVPQNWVNHYVNPVLNLSFEFNDPKKIREISSREVADKLRTMMAKIQEQYHLDELAVMEKKAGIVKTDIEVNFISKDSAKIQSAISRLETKLKSIEGVGDVINNVRLGKQEYKIKINNYGEQLGLSEVGIAKVLSAYFLGNRKGQTFGQDGVVDITTEFDQKDSIRSLKEFDVPLADGRSVQLSDVVDFIIAQDYELIEKEDGEIVKKVSANVDKKRITAGEVLEQLEPLLQSIRKEGVLVQVLGEKEKNQQLKNDMQTASIFALFIILILLLLIFPKIKYALMIMSVIPLSIFGALAGHVLMDINLTMPSIIGILGLAGVVINDGIIMLDFLHGTRDSKEFYYRASLRLRPIVITTITTFVGLSTLMFFATGQAIIMQPIAISLGFGLVWGTVTNLFYLPTLYAMVNKINEAPSKNS